MPAGRKPKPAALHLIAGNPSHLTTKQLAKRLEDERVPVAACCIPDLIDVVGMDALAHAEWQALGPKLVELGVLTAYDGAAFAKYCLAHARWVRAEKLFASLGPSHFVTDNGKGEELSLHLLAVIKLSEQADKLGAKFGLSPDSRAILLRNIRATETTNTNSADATKRDAQNKAREYF